LMGGELGDEDERLITRLENSQYKPVTDDDAADFKPLSHQPSSQPVQMYPGQQPVPNWPQDAKSAGARAGETGLPPANG